MRALVQHAPGPPAEVVELVEMPTPEPGPGQILCRVLAAPIAPTDLLAIRGHYPVGMPHGAPLGMQGIGYDERGVRWLLPMRAGSWASHVVVNPAEALRLPDYLSPVQSCGARINPCTALMLLEGCEGPVIVDPASSGVGQHILQIALARGLDVACVIRRPERRARLEELGATCIVEHPKELEPRFALAIDAAGGRRTARLARALAPGGRLVSIGATTRESPTLGIGDLVFRGIRVEGFWLLRENRLRPDYGADVLDQAIELLRKGTLHTETAAVYELEDWRDALAMAQSPERCGQVVLTP